MGQVFPRKLCALGCRKCMDADGVKKSSREDVARTGVALNGPPPALWRARKDMKEEYVQEMVNMAT